MLDFLVKLELSRKIFEKHLNAKFPENCSMRTDGHADGHDESLSEMCERAYKSRTLYLLRDRRPNINKNQVS